MRLLKLSNVAIILGAGNGTRMKSNKSKMLLDVMGSTVIERSVHAFAELNVIDEIIVTVREEDLETFLDLLQNDKVSFVIGGSTRQESVKAAVDTIDEADLIIIHDGARPLIQEKDILSTIQAAKDNGAAAVGVPVKDTIKVINSENIVVDTPNRATLFAVQTPQIFNFRLYKSALEKATADGKDFTDDCQLIEYAGSKVKMVQGDYSNIKITTPDDIAVAENILLQRIRRG